jgi:hypothetical protein
VRPLSGAIAVIAAVALAATVAFAAAMGPGVSSATLGSADAVVLAPPVEVTSVEWVTDYENGPGYVVDEVHVLFTFTDNFVGRLSFYVTVTGQAPLPLEYNEDKNLNKSAGSTTLIEASFESFNIPAEAVEDIHILVCDDDDGTPSGVCTAP